MAGNFGKPDPTGRSSGKLTGRSASLMRPPDGEPFVWLTRELVGSDAWQARIQLDPQNGPTPARALL